MDALIQSVLGKFDIVSLVQAVSRCQMKRATAEIISIKCGTNKANHKHTQKKQLQSNQAKWQIYNHSEAFSCARNAMQMLLLHHVQVHFIFMFLFSPCRKAKS